MPSAVRAALGYHESPNFVSAGDLGQRPFQGHSHIYRKAREQCGLQGVYLLSDPQRPSEVPVVFYCQAEDEAAAERIHQHIWNQGVVPFVLVETPKALRLYSGFRFVPRGANDLERGVLEASVAFNEVTERLAALRADAIDTGAVWDRWGGEVDPRSRVDWSLLAELEKLEAALRERGLEREPAHALIGKFVYLKYLRDRGILSDRKLAKWQQEAKDVFSHNATLTAFREVNARLDDWLNGSVFPLPSNAIRAEHLQLVAGVFEGGSAAGQLPLDLGIYDFSFIPIETLSVIYQQFLHASEEGQKSRGRETGAYYTPIPVVNYMLAELESRRPLEEGMRVLDPSCGSGAFLVQCYRTLIEKRLKQGPVRPGELRELLTKHIFGVDRDGDACQVAELSLILTLLDYTRPPDLESNPQFKLPRLQGSNIFRADFFDPDSDWAQQRSRMKADWLVGNPPWREIKRTAADDRHALAWMRRNAKIYPTGGNQVAEAFVWRSLPLLNESAVAALLLPAMTLFKLESTRFRARLFETVRAWCVTNFANLAYVLFAGRSKSPALALFFEPRADGEPGPTPQERILTFAPFLANQCAGRAKHARHGKDTWNVVVNGAELRELCTTAVATGDFQPWKEAMWGSFRDAKLLAHIAKRIPSLGEFAKQNGLHVHQGFELRSAGSGEKTKPMPELAGRTQVDFSKLKHCGRIFAFPPEALAVIPSGMTYVRKGRGRLPLLVSTPPHVILDASRRFAVYSEEFVTIPARKIGIAGPKGTADLLKALSIYLSSHFCTYQQFMTTPEWGVRTSLATLDALLGLPVPLGQLTDAELRHWARLQGQLISESSGGVTPSDASLREIDARVYRLLGINPAERILIEDFVHWSMQLVQGKVPADVVAPPTDRAMNSYMIALQGELDEFVRSDAGVSHDLHAVRAGTSAMVAIRLVHGAAQPPSLVNAGERTAAALARTQEHLLRRHSQWLYFERCLKVYQDGAMYVFKPLEMIHWTRRQAILDAGEVVAETLGAQGA